MWSLSDWRMSRDRELSLFLANWKAPQNKAVIGVTLLHFKMVVMPLVPETQMAGVCKLISFGNLLTRETLWLELKTTSATSVFSRVFEADSMTIIFYKYSNLPILTLFFTISLGESTQLSFNTLFPLRLPEKTLSRSQFRLTESIHACSFLQQSTATKIYTLCNHSFLCYTFSVRFFPASYTEISSNHRKKQTVEIRSQHA